MRHTQYTGSARRAELDGIRAIAVLLILLFHSGIDGLPGGYIGVDVFFVLSGYLITQLIVRDLHRGNFSFVAFYARRFTRLLPAALTTVFVTVLIAKIFLPETMAASVRNSGIAAIFYAANIFFWFDAGYFSDSAITKPLLHMWSLSVEEQFYLVYPFILWAAFRLGGYSALTAAVAVLTFASFIFCVYLSWYFPSSAYYMMPARFWQLGIGAMLVLSGLSSLWDRPSAGSAPLLIGTVSVILITVCALIFSEETVFPGIVALIPVLATAALIWSAIRSPALQRCLSVWPLEFTGRISYALYLVHWPIAVFLFFFGVVPGTTPFVLTCVGLSYVLALTLHYCVEKPGMTLRRFGELNIVRSTVVASCGFSLACVAVVALPISSLSAADPVISSLRRGADLPGMRVECDYMRHGLCHFGSGSGDARLAFVGDSHALMMRAVARAVAREKDLNILVLPLGPFCPPLLHIDTYDAKGVRNKRCRERTDRLLDQLRRSAVSDVILAARWQAYATRHGAVNRLFAAPGRSENSEATMRAFLDALKQTVNAIETLDIRVSIMEQVPVAGCHVKDILSQSSTLEDFEAKCPALSREKVEQRAGIGGAEFAQLRLPMIYTRTAFCDDLLCRTHDARRSLYVDTNHLSAAGGEFLASHWLGTGALDPLLTP
ncbi:MAG: acyltransferase [Halioglobus sp.]|nr:acyltransferase [Halioglobus sp.]